MIVERLDGVCLNVKNIEEATKFFSDIFGIKFYRSPTEILRIKKFGGDPLMDRITDPPNEGMKIVISPMGLELLEPTPHQEEVYRSFHFKVPDIEEAKKELKAKGIDVKNDIKQGNMKEAVLDAKQLLGARITLVEYDDRFPTRIDALLGKTRANRLPGFYW